MQVIRRIKATSPGVRQKTVIVDSDVTKAGPFKSLTESKRRINGRNSAGRITVRHRGGGHKRRYRVIDFKRDKDNIQARVVRIEYDPNRTAYIALVVYTDGEWRYIIAPKGLQAGQKIQSGEQVPVEVGNTIPLRFMPVGSTIHCIEMVPGKGAQIARSAGTYAQLVARENEYAVVRMRSGEVRKIHVNCRATIGTVSNSAHSLVSAGKAGASRHKGIRPTVRGVAMNPVDHPHGGGEGRTSGGRHPSYPSGQLKAKGQKTRKKHRLSDSMIISRRKNKRRR